MRYLVTRATRKKPPDVHLELWWRMLAFYMLRAWGFRDSVAIERPLPEYANPDISHNVEYSLYPILSCWKKESALPKTP